MESRLLELLYRSFDDRLSPDEQQELDAALAASEELQKEKERISALRSAVSSSGSASFEPFFADRVIQRIHSEKNQQSNGVENFFESLLWAFRRIAIAGAVAVILLFAANLSQGKELSLDSALAMPQLTLEDAWELEDFTQID